jgi:hypothetical protein
MGAKKACAVDEINTSYIQGGSCEVSRNDEIILPSAYMQKNNST